MGKGGGKSAARGGGGSSGSSQKGFEANFTAADFNQVSENRWESKRQTIIAVAWSGGANNRVPISEKGAQFEIVKQGDKYTSYIYGVGRRERIKSSKTLGSAISSINKYTRDYTVR